VIWSERVVGIQYQLAMCPMDDLGEPWLNFAPVISALAVDLLLCGREDERLDFQVAFQHSVPPRRTKVMANAALSCLTHLEY
jgi:hypothetical protein